ncbi:MAG: restriction endonuclease subunit S, partial [Romboutsia timonensis]|uniref:restriction endonuclease subunit S n=1 Tax=Romboutsia timonensis TaxID=1776391 RepID=UPI002A75F72F
YNRYLFFVLLAMRDYFKNQSFGGAQPNISKQKIINTPIILPPLEEQKRIVEKIDIIMNYLDTLQQEIESQEVILEDILK